MAGRYGNDECNRFLLVIGLVLLVVAQLIDVEALAIIPMAILGLVYFRMLSRNVYARRAENQKFMVFWRPYGQKLSGVRARHADRTHRYFKCKTCKRTLRVPRGKGKIEITCPHCRVKMTKKT